MSVPSIVKRLALTAWLGPLRLQLRGRHHALARRRPTRVSVASRRPPHSLSRPWRLHRGPPCVAPQPSLSVEAQWRLHPRRSLSDHPLTNTEISVITEIMELTPVMQKFILHWGEMGTRWGINRTVSQIHALLYLSPRPLHAEEIAETLSVARSNVSNSLRELQGWGFGKVGHVLGDRRDHFEAMKDVWEMFQVVIEGRKRREMDPTLAT